jgi:hypothetical protein
MESKGAWVYPLAAVVALLGTALLIVAFLVGDAGVQQWM